MKYIFIPLALFIVLNAEACPTAAGSANLTLDQVMINFGHFMTPADLAAAEGANNPASVSDEALKAAVNGVAAALDCAKIVLADKTGNLYPPKYFTLQGADQAAYLQLFFADMGNFASALSTYESLFQHLLAESAASRDFAIVKAQSDTVDDLATTAHGDLQ